MFDQQKLNKPWNDNYFTSVTQSWLCGLVISVLATHTWVICKAKKNKLDLVAITNWFHYIRYKTLIGTSHNVAVIHSMYGTGDIEDDEITYTQKHNDALKTLPQLKIKTCLIFSSPDSPHVWVAPTHEQPASDGKLGGDREQQYLIDVVWWKIEKSVVTGNQARGSWFEPPCSISELWPPDNHHSLQSCDIYTAQLAPNALAAYQVRYYHYHLLVTSSLPVNYAITSDTQSKNNASLVITKIFRITVVFSSLGHTFCFLIRLIKTMLQWLSASFQQVWGESTKRDLLTISNCNTIHVVAQVD